MNLTYEIELREDGTVQSAEWYYKGADGSYTSYYKTNNAGDGIFFVNLKKNDCSQMVGTCDFSVCGLKVASAKAKIRKWMNS